MRFVRISRVSANGEVPMKKLSLALAFAMSIAAFPASAFEGCGGYVDGHAHGPVSQPVASTDEATAPATVAVEPAQPTTTAQIPAPSTTN
jgi:hypothetical protein